jgi:hypothetical protein
VREVFEQWSDFNVAVAGATAALAGLLIVAMSVNIERILAARGVLSRAGAAVGALVLAVIASCLCLVPTQPVWAFGAETLIGAVLVGAMAVAAMRGIYADQTQSRRGRPVKSATSFIPPLAFGVGAVILLAGDPGGYGWVAAGSLLSILNGILFSWVALVEVLR